jgi:O-methyltransferase/methyltransferase family protein
MTPSETEASEPASSQLIQLTWGFMASQAFHVAAKLAVFDVLRDGPKTVREVAEATDSQEIPLRRLLRFLTTLDVVTEDEKGRFSSTTLGALLRSDHPQSVRPMALMYGEPFFWRAWGDLYETVKTGKPAFERVFGQPFFEYLAQNPEEGAIFNAAMTGFSKIDVPAILEAYDFSGLARIVDVAGGHGALLRTILERYPDSRGVLCDRPSVIAGATELKRSDVATRCELVAADFFKSVPAGGDAYILKWILHNWNDDEAVHILKNCRRGIAAGGKVLALEQVVKPSNQPDPAKWMDLNMLTLLTGRERTEAEFGELYARAGFKLTRVVPAMRLSIVEGVAA